MNDWHQALEYVKNDYVDPGKQPELVRRLAEEAIDYVTKHDLVTIPPLAREDWWEEMLSPQRQLTSPFFLGGDHILVAFPTDTMTQEQKLMSLRGNNIHFARATVFHELIPGHHLQGFMADRYRTYRAPFATPFWTEGDAFYWEMLLWDMGFAQTPEDRIGMLFWRMHRSARIIFSLSYHMKQMTAQECVDFLVDKVGFERENALAEVRRSFDGSYEPIYQCAYMLGALQFYALHKELVGFGENDQPRISRRDPEGKPDSSRNDSRRSHAPEADARFQDQLAILQPGSIDGSGQVRETIRWHHNPVRRVGFPCTRLVART